MAKLYGDARHEEIARAILERRLVVPEVVHPDVETHLERLAPGLFGRLVPGQLAPELHLPAHGVRPKH